MPEGRVTEIMRAADRMDGSAIGQKGRGRMVLKGLCKLARDAACYLGNLERVGQTGAVEVAVAEIEDLGLALEAPERSGVNDARIVDVTIVARILALRCPALAAGRPYDCGL